MTSATTPCNDKLASEHRSPAEFPDLRCGGRLFYSVVTGMTVAEFSALSKSAELFRRAQASGFRIAFHGLTDREQRNWAVFQIMRLESSAGGRIALREVSARLYVLRSQPHAEYYRQRDQVLATALQPLLARKMR